MKLIRYYNNEQILPGVIINEKYYSVAAFFDDYDEGFFGEDGMEKLQNLCLPNLLPELPTDIRLAAPLAPPSKIICIGLNYRDHAAETNAAIPAEPIIFFKSTSAMSGPNDDLIIPKGSTKTDWEVELALVIGKKAQYVDKQNGLKHIAGYMLHNDYSEREWQLERGGQWVKGKSCDTFAPIGPFIATPDEFTDVSNLNLWLKVNGKTMQQSNTSNLIFDVGYLVSYVSQFMTLLPGDIISTGTPHGVGLGQKPEPWYLKPGDVVELGIDGLGTQKQQVKAWQP